MQPTPRAKSAPHQPAQSLYFTESYQRRLPYLGFFKGCVSSNEPHSVLLMLAQQIRQRSHGDQP
jgi:hypothetical protein